MALMVIFLESSFLISQCSFWILNQIWIDTDVNDIGRKKDALPSLNSTSFEYWYKESTYDSLVLLGLLLTLWQEFNLQFFYNNLLQSNESNIYWRISFFVTNFHNS